MRFVCHHAGHYEGPTTHWGDICLWNQFRSNGRNLYSLCTIHLGVQYESQGGKRTCDPSPGPMFVRLPSFYRSHKNNLNDSSNNISSGDLTDAFCIWTDRLSLARRQAHNIRDFRNGLLLCRNVTRCPIKQSDKRESHIPWRPLKVLSIWAWSDISGLHIMHLRYRFSDDAETPQLTFHHCSVLSSCSWPPY